MFFRKLPTAAIEFPSIGYQPRWVWSLCIQLSSSILSLALPILILQIYDRILVYAKIETLNVLCLFTVIAILTEGLLRFCHSYDVGWAARSFEHTIQANIIRHILTLGTDEANKSSTELAQLSHHIGKLKDIWGGRMLLAFIDVPFVFFFLLIFYFIAGYLVFVPLVVLAGMLLWTIISKKKIAILLRQCGENNRHRHKAILQFLENIHVIKALGFEGLFERIYEKRQFDSTISNYEISRRNAHLFDGGIFFSRAIIIGTVLAGAPLVINRQISMGVLVACVILSGRIIHPVQRILGFFQKHEEAKHILENLHGVFSSTGKFGTEVTLEKPRGDISVHNLTYKDAFGSPLLNKINLELKAGEAILIKGTHSDGRNILLELIAGLRLPQEGTILVDKYDPMLISSEKLVTHIGLLSANAPLFKGTLYDNLSRFGYFEEKEVKEITSLLSLDDYIEKTPEGYETFLNGGNAEVVSPGIKQLIALARILISKPKIILYDHADEALDKESYNALYKLMSRLKGRVTFIFISEDKYIQELADRVFSLEEGNLKTEKVRRVKAFKEIKA